MSVGNQGSARVCDGSVSYKADSHRNIHVLSEPREVTRVDGGTVSLPRKQAVCTRSTLSLSTRRDSATEVTSESSHMSSGIENVKKMTPVVPNITPQKQDLTAAKPPGVCSDTSLGRSNGQEPDSMVTVLSSDLTGFKDHDSLQSSSGFTRIPLTGSLSVSEAGPSSVNGRLSAGQTQHLSLTGRLSANESEHCSLYATPGHLLPGSYSSLDSEDPLLQGPAALMTMSYKGTRNYSCTENENRMKTLPQMSNHHCIDFDLDFESVNGEGLINQSYSKGKRCPEAEKPAEDGIKTKLMSAWNNVRHGWTVKTKTQFKVGEPIVTAGRVYQLPPRDKYSEVQCSNTGFEGFKRDFTSRIWFTYRKGFPPLLDTDITSDTGWGCMIRTAQMLLAQGLVWRYLGRNWRLLSKDSGMGSFHRRIIKFFSEDCGEKNPLSLHTLVKIGAMQGKKIGDWYGPASVTHVIKEAMLVGGKREPCLKNIALYVAQDCTVYKQDVIDLCSSPSNTEPEAASVPSGGGHWKSLILVIPVRLGTSGFNTAYSSCIKEVLAHKSCLGIIGGKPKHSLYFVGWQDDKLIYMDPHFCQDIVDTRQPDFSLQSFHCRSPRKMAISKMDPSCAVGFYCQTCEEFDEFCHEVSKIAAPPSESGMYPMFVITDGRGSDMVGPSAQGQSASQRKPLAKTASEDSDYVFL